MDNFLDKGGFLVLIESPTEKKIYPLFLGIESIKDPFGFEALFKGVNALIKEVFGGDMKMENVPVYSFLQFPFYEYGLTKEEVHCLFEEEFYNASSGKIKEYLFKKHLLSLKQGKRYIYPNNIVGAVVRGDNFYNREEFIEGLWEKLKTENIFLSAPRRFGKTSCMYYLYDHPKPAWQTLHLELQHIHHPKGFVAEMIARFCTQEKNRGFEEIIEMYNPSGMDNLSLKMQIEEMVKDNTWQKMGEDFLGKLLERIPNHSYFLLLFDEFIYMMENFKKEEASSFAEWFFEQRKKNKLRFLIASSVCLNQYLKSHSLDRFFNDFIEVKIPPLSKDEALRFIDELLLSKKIRIKDEVKEEVFNLVGQGVPYFIQMLLCEVKEKITPEEIKRIYQEKILGPDYKQYFFYFFQRLQSHPYIFLAGLLKRLSLEDKVSESQLFEWYKEYSGKEDKEDFREILTYLSDEFYVEKDNEGKYSFFCKILKDWWRRQ
ncbi:MAG: hypothetical protein AB1422_02155 [bacterium]